VHEHEGSSRGGIEQRRELLSDSRGRRSAKSDSGGSGNERQGSERGTNEIERISTCRAVRKHDLEIAGSVAERLSKFQSSSQMRRHGGEKGRAGSERGRSGSGSRGRASNGRSTGAWCGN